MKRKPATSKTSQSDSHSDDRRIMPIGMHPSLADAVGRIVRRALRLREPTSDFEIKIRDAARRLRAGNRLRLSDLEIEQMVVNLVLNNCFGIQSEMVPQRCHRAELDTRLATVDDTITFDCAGVVTRGKSQRGFAPRMPRIE